MHAPRRGERDRQKQRAGERAIRHEAMSVSMTEFRMKTKSAQSHPYKAIADPNWIRWGCCAKCSGRERATLCVSANLWRV